MDRARGVDGSTAVPDVYEFLITGRIGPLALSCLPELTTVTASPSTTLIGTVDGTTNCDAYRIC